MIHTAALTVWFLPLLLAALPNAVSNASEPDCKETGERTVIVMECQDEEDFTHHPRDREEEDPDNSEVDLTTYRSVWLPACAAARPERKDASHIDCATAHTCPDPKDWSMILWRTMVTNAAGEPVPERWEYIRSECRAPEDNPDQEPPPITWHDVRTALTRVGLPHLTVAGPAFTLVNLETTFYTEPHPIDTTVTLLGQRVRIQAEPASYTWHWGDGTSTRTTSPGRPWPATDITHTYTHATDDGPGLQLRVDTTYTARYRIEHGPWQQLPRSITVPGNPTALPVKQASSVIVDNK